MRFQRRIQLSADPSLEECCRYLYCTTAITEFCDSNGTPEEIAFLHEALKQEVMRREENRQAKLLKEAHFPTYKTFTGYEYSSVRLPYTLSKESLEQVSFIESKENLVLYGPVGLGKTHMAIAAGVSACNKGYKTRFSTVTELVLRLAEARKRGNVETLRNMLNSLDLLILDEWGYVPIDREGSQLLFQMIADSYEKKSLILTTNLEFSKWGSVFTDPQMSAAMIDRLVHHGHLILFEGSSYRMTHSLMNKTS